MVSTQMQALKDLYDDYTNDSRFEHLRQEGINFVGGSGPLNPKLMLIGEAPGRLENAKRIPFVGPAGLELNNLLEFIEVDVDDVFITNVIKYWPRDVDNKTRTPTENEVEVSRDYLQQEIGIVDPDIVGLCGLSAIKCVYPDITRVQSKHGRLLNELYVPLYHPATILYDESRRSLVEMGFLLLKQYLNNKERAHHA